VATIHTVRGGRGLKLHVREWGNSDGPAILLIHGWSQNHLSWAKQYGSSLSAEFRLAALDLRGHGMSEAPLGPENYNDPQIWADDIAAIIRALNLERPVLVGWSYGGAVVSDYVRAYGQSELAGINYVAAVVGNQAGVGNLIGPGFRDHALGSFARDLPTNIQAMRSFLRDCLVKPVSQEDFEVALAYNVAVPAEVREALTLREIDSDDVLSGLTVPVLVTHGKEDCVSLPAMGAHILDVCLTAKASWYEGVGHAPFLEEPERFNEELAAFVHRAQARASR
jgi:pimeloyl-ACP methyl ester carboxylesterase